MPARQPWCVGSDLDTGPRSLTSPRLGLRYSLWPMSVREWASNGEPNVGRAARFSKQKKGPQ